VEIWIRADSGFARDEIMAWCEANSVEYVLGLARNPRRVGLEGSFTGEGTGRNNPDALAEPAARSVSGKKEDSQSGTCSRVRALARSA
jgi:hypothetical protein